MYWRYHCTILIVWINTLEFCEPIMVKFGTSNEPIPFKEPARSTSLQARSIISIPAPVTEVTDDIPNPNQYRPAIPKQYRTKQYLFSQETANQFYTSGFDDYNIYRTHHSRKLGPDHTGPHTFERQAYEFAKPRKHFWKSPVKYLEGKRLREYHQSQKLVPQLGVVSTVEGVLYYVPNQYFRFNQESLADENSVYDKNEKNYVK